MIILTKTWLSHVLAEVSCISLSAQKIQTITTTGVKDKWYVNLEIVS